jgi:hypothetical protein
MILINSGKYIDQELQSEIGCLPPCFLPLKNVRLYKHQINTIKDDNFTFISLPIDFNVPNQDAAFFDLNNIRAIKIPLGISLGDSVFRSLGEISKLSNEVTILHGDTLILDSFEFEVNTFAVSNHIDNYNWGKINNDSNLVYAGLFHIKDVRKFRKCLLNSDYNFISALEKYKETEHVVLFEVHDWFDFGHVNTFYRSRASMPNLRYFNSMTIKENVVVKSSENILKIRAEANWFNEFPVELSYYLPQFLGLIDDYENTAYKIEYQYLITLNELYAFGDQKFFIWKNIIDSCFQFLKNINSFKKDCPKSYLNNSLFHSKTKERIVDFLSENSTLSSELYYQGEKLGTLFEIVDVVNQKFPLPTDEHISVVHGDFCFSNIFFDYRRQDIKVIDPRGLNHINEIDIYGDIRYDYAKFAHSIIGNYDNIIAGNYRLIDNKVDFDISFYDSELTFEMQEYFWNNVDLIENLNISREVIISGMVNLFLSMLPLHKESHSRQMALLANALRLYKVYLL